MKYILIILSSLIFSVSSSIASELYARVVQIEENYETITEYSPIKVCRDEEVPIYGNTNQNNNSGNVLLGMILGGVSGKVITGEDGGAAVGAIAGGLIGANNNNGNNQIIGFRTVQTCSMEKKEVKSTKLRNYKVTYDFHGALGTSYSFNSYLVGDRIPVNVSVVAK